MTNDQEMQTLFTTAFGGKLRELGLDERFIEQYTELKMKARDLEARNEELGLLLNQRHAADMEATERRLEQIAKLEARNAELEKLYESACQRFDRLDKQV